MYEILSTKYFHNQLLSSSSDIILKSMEYDIIIYLSHFLDVTGNLYIQPNYIWYICNYLSHTLHILRLLEEKLIYHDIACLAIYWSDTSPCLFHTTFGFGYQLYWVSEDQFKSQTRSLYNFYHNFLSNMKSIW